MNAYPAILNHDETDEEEEAISLSNSPMAQLSGPPQLFTSEPSEMFEFFNDLSSSDIMSHAEDIIFCGKLIPLEGNPFNHREIEKQNFRNGTNAREEEEKPTSQNGKRSGSGHMVKYATQPNSPRSNRQVMRNTMSLDYQRLRRSLSSDCQSAGLRGYSRTRSSGRYDCLNQKVYKPRWYSMLFGLMSKVPPEMELRDLKSRLVGRPPSTMFPSSDSSANFPSHRGSSWGFLGILSCKDSANVGVTASFRCTSLVDSCENALPRATST